MSTIHAESVQAVINRLESEPMNIPRPLIAMIDAIMVIERTETEGKPARRTTTTTEVSEFDQETRKIQTNEVFSWNRNKDNFVFSGHNNLLMRHGKKKGITKEEIKDELNRRRTVLEWMVEKDIRHYSDVANVIREYYANPKRVYQKARMGLR